MAATTRLITLRVTASNIRRGERGRSNRCPVALALKRRKFRRVTVADDGISMDDGPRFLVFCPD